MKPEDPYATLMPRRMGGQLRSVAQVKAEYHRKHDHMRRTLRAVAFDKARPERQRLAAIARLSVVC
jgi:hypothetical protein